MPTSCFFGCSRPSPPPPPPPPSFCTTFYHTPLGSASLTWSRSLLGLSLSALLPIPSSPSSPSSPSFSAASSSSSSLPAPTHSRFRLHPSLLWRRRGSRRFRLRAADHQQRNPPTLVDFSWDLSRATFSGGGPDPTGAFFLAVSVDGEAVLVVGDEEGLRRARRRVPRSAIGLPATPLSRREHVVVAEGGGGMWPCKYVTRALAGGKERKVALEIGGRAEKDVRLCVAIDGRRVLQVKRLRWKFRGNERIEFDGGAAAIRISWDVHKYLFATSNVAATTSSDRPPPSETNHAVVLLRFEAAETRSHLWTRPTASGLWGVYGLLGQVGAAERIAGGGAARQRRLMKTRSASSNSSMASTGSGWSVADWQSAEENELKEINGFSLLISLARR